MTTYPKEHEQAEDVWHRLRRRKVVQWGLVYVAGAWGFLQGLEYVSETFHWPEQIRQMSLLALLIGLPIVLVLSWYHGDRGEQRVRGTELLIVTLLFLAGGGIFWLYDRGREPGSAIATQATADISTPAASRTAPDAKSIAVLPFADMSAAKDQEYMADGMADELLNLLAKVPDLKVIARTSSFAFKGEKIDIAEIARKLNVAHILEGSVRTSGDKVRITAQLVRASDSTHLWSETYDRPLDDIFAVQDEVASRVIDALAVTLLNGKDTPRTNTRDSQAYNLYLRGRFFAQKRTKEDSERALHYLREALALNPSDALVRVELANVYLMQAEDGWAPFEEGYELAEEQIEAALKLDPRLGTAYSALGWIQLIHLEWSAMEESMRKATLYAPGNAEVLLRAGWIAAELGQWDRALSLIDSSIERDPLSIYGHEYRAYLLSGLGQPAEAESSYRIAFELNPEREGSRASIALALLQQGKPRDALRELREESRDPWTLFALCLIHHSLGHAVKSDSYLQSLEDLDAADVPIRVAEAHAWRGESDLAFKWLDIAFEQGSSYVYDIKINPYFRMISDDPRYAAFLRKMKLPLDQAPT